MIITNIISTESQAKDFAKEKRTSDAIAKIEANRKSISIIKKIVSEKAEMILLSAKLPKSRQTHDLITDVPVSKMEGQSRIKEYVICRHVAIAIIRMTLPISLKAIGWQFDNRHYASIINSINIIEEMRYTVKSFDKCFQEVLKECKLKIERSTSVLDFTKGKTPVTQ